MSAVQSAAPQGDHNVIVQASGDGINIEVALPWLELVPVKTRVRERLRQDIDILNPAFQAVPLIGRESDLQYLFDWRASERAIAVTAPIGRGRVKHG